jgi:hypothetical protein
MMVHPDPSKRAKLLKENDEDYIIEESDWYTQTPEASLEEV